MGFAKPKEKVGPIIEYLIEQSKVKEKTTMLQSIANAFKKVETMISGFSLTGIWNWMKSLRLKILDKISTIYKSWLQHGTKAPSNAGSSNELSDAERAAIAGVDDEQVQTTEENNDIKMLEP